VIDDKKLLFGSFPIADPPVAVKNVGVEVVLASGFDLMLQVELQGTKFGAVWRSDFAGVDCLSNPSWPICQREYESGAGLGTLECFAWLPMHAIRGLTT
jgi:hypothetical protein